MKTHQRVHKILHHGTDFLLLVILFGLGFGALLLFSHQVDKQILVAILMPILYAMWGIIHHYHEGNLTLEVSLEYIGVASLVGFILIIFLLRA